MPLKSKSFIKFTIIKDLRRGQWQSLNSSEFFSFEENLRRKDSNVNSKRKVFSYRIVSRSFPQYRVIATNDYGYACSFWKYIHEQLLLPPNIGKLSSKKILKVLKNTPLPECLREDTTIEILSDQENDDDSDVEDMMEDDILEDFQNRPVLFDQVKSSPLSEEEDEFDVFFNDELRISTDVESSVSPGKISSIESSPIRTSSLDSSPTKSRFIDIPKRKKKVKYPQRILSHESALVSSATPLFSSEGGSENPLFSLTDASTQALHSKSDPGILSISDSTQHLEGEKEQEKNHQQPLQQTQTQLQPSQSFVMKESELRGWLQQLQIWISDLFLDKKSIDIEGTAKFYWEALAGPKDVPSSQETLQTIRERHLSRRRRLILTGFTLYSFLLRFCSFDFFIFVLILSNITILYVLKNSRKINLSMAKKSVKNRVGWAKQYLGGLLNTKRGSKNGNSQLNTTGTSSSNADGHVRESGGNSGNTVGLGNIGGSTLLSLTSGSASQVHSSSLGLEPTTNTERTLSHSHSTGSITHTSSSRLRFPFGSRSKKLTTIPESSNSTHSNHLSTVKQKISSSYQDEDSYASDYNAFSHNILNQSPLSGYPHDQFTPLKKSPKKSNSEPLFMVDHSHKHGTNPNSILHNHSIHRDPSDQDQQTHHMTQESCMTPHSNYHSPPTLYETYQLNQEPISSSGSGSKFNIAGGIVNTGALTAQLLFKRKSAQASVPSLNPIPESDTKQSHYNSFTLSS